MTLDTIVGEQLAERLRLRRAALAQREPQATDMAVHFRGMSMRFLETALALTAIATAVILGLAR